MYPSVSKLLIYGTTCPILTKHKTLLPKVMEIQNWLNIYGPLSFQRGDYNNSIKVLVVSAMPVSHRLLVWVLLWFMMLCSKRRQGPAPPPPHSITFLPTYNYLIFTYRKILTCYGLVSHHPGGSHHSEEFHLLTKCTAETHNKHWHFLCHNSEMNLTSFHITFSKGR